MTTPMPAQQSSSNHTSGLPVHVAIIMDGNGRWATERGMPRLDGHNAGTENIRTVIRTFAERGIQYLTMFAFSTENWSRPQSEVQGLWHLLGDVIDRELPSLHENGIRLRHIGRRDRLPGELLAAIDHATGLTKDNARLTLSVALDYGGRAEIVAGIREILRDKLAPEQITEDRLAAYLYTIGLPDPDLVIRTAGELRLSNFLIWQCAYAEIYVTQTYWPDFGPAEIDKALEAYSRRQRRFGGVTSNTPAR